LATLYQYQDSVKSISRFLAIAIFSILAFSGSATKTYAQFNACKDTLQVYVAPCYDTSYNPVCGCDQQTYMNYCAWSQASLFSFTPRACEEITIPHIYPNPSSTWMNYRIYLKQQEDAFVYIYDEYGRPKYYHFFENALDVSTQIDVTTLPSGAYIMLAVANGHFAAKKFIKY